MGTHILDAMAREGFEEVIALHDRASGLRAFLGIHDTLRGPAFGGIRRWGYLDERQALIDCLRLSRAMTHKCALADLPAGGGKLVVLDDPDLDLELAYTAIGRAVERLGGRFYTGPDVGTGEAELEYACAQTRYVTSPGPAGPGQLADATAEGVFQGMASGLRHLDGEEDWERRTVVIQGLGEVGARLAKRLAQRGARVFGAEIDPDRAAEVASELNIELVDPATETSLPCDVFAPCAMGGIVHDVTLERLRCRLVAGGANNVLARALHGDRLHERQILYAPDFLLNSGALIRGALFHLEGRREPVDKIGERIGRAMDTIFARAAEEDLPPARVAIREAEDRISRWRGEGRPEAVR
jgi:leucine dehydrogenase